MTRIRLALAVLILPPLLLAAILAASVSLLPWWGAPVLNRFIPVVIEAATDAEAQIRIDLLNWNILNIHQFELHFPDGQSLSVEDLRIEFTFLQLLSSEIDDLYAKSIQIDLPAESESINTSGNSNGQTVNIPFGQQHQIQLPDLTPWLTLPNTRIQIDSLQLDHPELKLLASLAMNSENPQQAPELTLTGDVEFKAFQQSRELLFTFNSEQNGLIRLSQGETKQLELTLTVEQKQDQTRISWQSSLDIPAVSKLLSLQSEPQMPFDNLITEGWLASPNLATWPDDLTGEVKTTINIPKASTRSNKKITLSADAGAPELYLSEGTLLLELMRPTPDQTDWQIDLSHPKARLHLKEPRQTLKLAATTYSLSCTASAEHCENQKPLKLAAQLSGPEIPSTDISTNISLNWAASTNELSGALTSNARTSSRSFPAAWIAGQLTPFSSETNDLSAEVTTRFKLAPLHTDVAGKTGSAGLTEMTKQADYVLTLDQTRLTFNSTPMRYQSEQPDESAWNIGGLKLTAALNQPLTIGSAGMTPVKVNTQLDSVTLSSGKKKIRTGATQLECLISDDQIDCDINASLKPSKWEQWPIPDAQLQSRLQLIGDDIQLKTQLNAGLEQLKVIADLDHNLTTETGQAQIRWMPTPLDWNALGLADMQTLTSVQLLGGALGGQGWFNWDMKTGLLEPDLILRGDGINAIYNNEIVAEDWRFLLALQPDRLKNNDEQQAQNLDISAQFSGQSLNAGINISNLLASAQVSLNTQTQACQLQIDEAHAGLLGGQVRIQNAIYDSSQPENQILTRIDGLQMSDIAKLEPSADLAATGILDGEIPVVINEQGIWVDDGQLKSRAPGGQLVYSSESTRAISASDPTAGLAFRALENFQYRMLTSDIRYQPSGDARLALGFEGKNPDFFDGQTTRLNVNLDYNLLDLLESLRLTDQLIENVEAKYR